jgi:large subunit ribosomal protein L6
MSKVGTLPINILDGVKVEIENNLIKVSGPKGFLSMNTFSGFEIDIKENIISIIKKEDGSKAIHGLFRSLLNNKIIGVSVGFSKKLNVVGVGYKVELKANNSLNFSLGYSHTICFVLPKEIKAKVELDAKKNYNILLESIDNQLLGFIANKIKFLRKVEPYKGKGIHIDGEYIRRKVGKTGSKK